MSALKLQLTSNTADDQLIPKKPTLWSYNENQYKATDFPCNQN
jgi:hypothetical protein